MVSYLELFTLLVIGALQPAVELSLGTQAATFYNFAAAVVVGLYVAFLAYRDRKTFRSWGFRLDNFLSAILPYSLFTAFSALCLFVYVRLVGGPSLPFSFWYLLALYPVWGIAQQFVLQNLVVKNLTAFLPNVVFRSLAAAVLFSLAHAPSVPLMVVTVLAGFCFTLLHDKYKNLWALGISHGILGALVFYLVLGQDQWQILQEYLLR